MITQENNKPAYNKRVYKKQNISPKKHSNFHCTKLFLIIEEIAKSPLFLTFLPINLPDDAKTLVFPTDPLHL